MYKRQMKGVKMLFGAELNIMDAEGTVDLPEATLRGLDIIIASIHPPCLSLIHILQQIGG